MTTEIPEKCPREILLHSRHVVLVDAEDYERVLAAGPWHVRKHCGNKYARREPKIAGDVTRMHRFILELGPGDRRIVDHINGNGLDNQKSNLRFASNGQNKANSRKERGSSSRFKGVSWKKKHRKWAASITADGKYHWLGHFDSENEAAKAYDRAAVTLFGSYAKTNLEVTTHG